jgi:hypothetical protein
MSPRATRQTEYLEIAMATGRGSAAPSLFVWQDSFKGDFHARGFVVLRGIIPASLVAELRIAADELRDLAHHDSDPQAQTTQTLDRYADHADLAPFARYLEVDEIHEAISRLLGPGFRYDGLDRIRLLIEPLDHPWQIGWHRDRVAEVPAEARDPRFRSFLTQHWDDTRYFNQVNAAIYPDSCTWYVPESHRRQSDRDGEDESVMLPELRAAPSGTSPGTTEAALLAHCRKVPGAIQIHLDPGDLLLYHQLGWHTGSYSPARPRATIHHVVRHSTSEQFERKWERETTAAISRSRWRRFRHEPVRTLMRRARRRGDADPSGP